MIPLDLESILFRDERRDIAELLHLSDVGQRRLKSGLDMKEGVLEGKSRKIHVITSHLALLLAPIDSLNALVCDAQSFVCS